MNDQEIEAVAVTLGLLLDDMHARHGIGDGVLREAIVGIADMLGERGGMGLMGKVMDRVLDQKPEAESWREGVIDRCFSGFGGWGS
jgi:hypothetical protein